MSLTEVAVGVNYLTLVNNASHITVNTERICLISQSCKSLLVSSKLAKCSNCLLLYLVSKVK